MLSLPEGQMKPGFADAAGACTSAAPSAPAVSSELRPSLMVLFIVTPQYETGVGG